jgi:hypothetical protein
MAKSVFMAALACMFFMQTPAIHPQSDFRPSVKTDTSSANLGDIPPLPRGKTTIFGGAIQDFDPVRDRLTLNVVGERPMHIFFDERTQVFRDGVKIPLRQLGKVDHASVETTLDGQDIFAVSIHILSQGPAGQYEGRVVNYDRTTGALTIDASSSREPLKVFVSGSTHVARAGQQQFTSVQSGLYDLAPGSLVSIAFQPGKPGRAVASAITVLAVPGSSFAFSGSIASIDLHSGLMVLVNSTDQKSYEISFRSTALPEGHTLRTGDHVMVTAAYNGSSFMASSIAAN